MINIRKIILEEITTDQYQSIIRYWQNQLGIEDWVISTESINPETVSYDDQDYFIGIQRDFNNKVGVIYHDIPLKEIDICHELLHIKHPEEQFPDLDYYEYEDWIDTESTKLVNTKNINESEWDWTEEAVPMEQQNPEDWVGKSFGYGKELKDEMYLNGRRYSDENEIFQITAIDVNGNLSLTKYHPIDGEYSDIGVTVKTLRDNISDGTWVWV
jgi:hypothetical protein